MYLAIYLLERFFFNNEYSTKTKKDTNVKA